MDNHMAQLIVMLLSRNADFTKHKTHSDKLWVINNITAGVEIYFSIDGDFLYMNPLDRI